MNDLLPLTTDAGFAATTTMPFFAVPPATPEARQPWICPSCGRGLGPYRDSCDHGGMFVAPPVYPGWIPTPSWPTIPPWPFTPYYPPAYPYTTITCGGGVRQG